MLGEFECNHRRAGSVVDEFGDEVDVFRQVGARTVRLISRNAFVRFEAVVVFFARQVVAVAVAITPDLTEGLQLTDNKDLIKHQRLMRSIDSSQA